MRTCNILVVDDDPDDRDILTETFQQIGVERIYGVATAEAAIVFLQEIADDRDLPKLIITDLNMPGISGYELLRALKEMHRYQHIPVIVCSTSSAVYEAENCLASGAKDYITKPSAISDYLHITHKMSRLVLA
jgi:CheY-like chemotaxis protein